MEGPADHISDDVEELNHTPLEYCKITFDHWLDIFLEYAVVLAVGGDKLKAYEIIVSATAVKVFHDSKDFMFTIHIAWSSKSYENHNIFDTANQPHSMCFGY